MTSNIEKLQNAINETTSKSSLPIQYLDEKFFLGTRNVLTQTRLKKLADFAKSIPIPQIFGTFHDEEHFAQTTELMLCSTLETRHRGIFFNRIVLPSLQNKNSLLDIGPGDGQLTSWVSSAFKNITAIDTNRGLLDNLNIEKKLRKHISLNKIHGSLLDIRLPFKKFDLAMLSHVLYYIDKTRWMEAVEKAYQTLKPSGLLAIVLSGDRLGKAELIENFSAKAIDINWLAQQCIDKYGNDNVRIYASIENIRTIDLTAMLHIAGFFLCDAGTKADRQAITDYVISNYKLSEDLYIMSTVQKFILINK